MDVSYIILVDGYLDRILCHGFESWDGEKMVHHAAQTWAELQVNVPGIMGAAIFSCLDHHETKIMGRLPPGLDFEKLSKKLLKKFGESNFIVVECQTFGDIKKYFDILQSFDYNAMFFGGTKIKLLNLEKCNALCALVIIDAESG